MAVLKTPLFFFLWFFRVVAKNYEPKNEGKNNKRQNIRQGQGLSSANSCRLILVYGPADAEICNCAVQVSTKGIFIGVSEVPYPTP